MKYRFPVRQVAIFALLALFLSAGSVTSLIAEEKSGSKMESPAEAASNPVVEKEKTLLGAIAARQKELDEREAAIMVEEARLQDIKREGEKRIKKLQRTLEK